MPVKGPSVMTIIPSRYAQCHAARNDVPTWSHLRPPLRRSRGRQTDSTARPVSSSSGNNSRVYKLQVQHHGMEELGQHLDRSSNRVALALVGLGIYIAASLLM